MSKNESDNSLLIMLRKNISLWGIVAFLALVIVPIALKIPEPYLKVLMAVGTSLFVALTVSYYINKKISATTNYEITELIDIKFPKLLEIEEIGLEKIFYDNKMESIGIDLSEPAELYIAMNDGKNFFTNNSRKLSERFKKENRITTIILMSPESESEKILNSRYGKQEADYYAHKIKDVVKDFIDFHVDSPESNILEIFYFNYNVSMSVVATENVAIVGLYRNSAGKSLTPPSFLFRNIGNGNSGEYSNILKDIKNLVKASKAHWTSIKSIQPSSNILKEK
ncbi:hypothetical protein F3X86_20740 [Aeromonas veronii]|uniref:hypothetical protein n=1 Tax=Aeromonas veronii TaxID=654 RepID=UPI0012485C3B|nr:hypothetical protein [Aeromonas veronii]KAB0662813.1 hypothetical protein F3X86_20740 [Aeromonas veronii]